MGKASGKLVLPFLCAATVIYCITLSSPGGHQNEDPRQTPVVKAVARILPSVVNLSTERIVQRHLLSPRGGSDPFNALLEDFYAEQDREEKKYSLGSGCIIDSLGLIVTNAHVVQQATRIMVTLSDGKTFQARELATDDFNDLALLEILDLPKNASIQPIKMAKPGDLLLGEPVIIAGNPYGLGHSISSGVLSAVGRKIIYEGKVLFSDILQVDAAVYPGNSGGPLVNINGEMIGINTAIHKEANGIGFAIPLERVQNVLAKWLIPERRTNLSLGIVPAQRCLPGGRIEIYLADVMEGSPAQKAGLAKGDILTAIDGAPVELSSLGHKLWRMKEGDRLQLTVPGKQTFKLSVETMKFADGRDEAKRRLGLGVQPLTKQLALALGFPFEGGVVISEFPGAADAQRGELLARLGDVPIYSIDDISRALQGKHYGDKIEALMIVLAQTNGTRYLLKKSIEFTVK